LEAVDNVVAKEQQVQDSEGRWYFMRIHPYKTADKKIDGAVVVLFDVETIKQKEISTTLALGAAENILDTIREPFLVLDSNLHIRRANETFYQMFHITAQETVGRLLYNVDNGQWNIPKLKIKLEEIIKNKNTFKDLEIEHKFRTAGLKTLLLNASKIRHGKEDLVLLAMEDITERKQLTDELKRKAIDVARSNRDLTDFAHIVSHDLQSPLNKIISFGDLLKMEINTALNEKGGDYLNRIQNGATKMGQLIKSLLDYSKVTAAEHELRRWIWGRSPKKRLKISIFRLMIQKQK
jgi:two-component system CheB/CheR fusion protein